MCLFISSASSSPASAAGRSWTARTRRPRAGSRGAPRRGSAAARARTPRPCPNIVIIKTITIITIIIMMIIIGLMIIIVIIVIDIIIINFIINLYSPPVSSCMISREGVLSVAALWLSPLSFAPGICASMAFRSACACCGPRERAPRLDTDVARETLI